MSPKCPSQMASLRIKAFHRTYAALDDGDIESLFKPAAIEAVEKWRLWMVIPARPVSFARTTGHSAKHGHDSRERIASSDLPPGPRCCG
jgi:hypothetical protein